MRRYRLYISFLTITVLLTAALVLTGCDTEHPTVTSREQTLLAPGGVGKTLVINIHSTGVLSVGEPAAEAEAFEVVDYLVFMCRHIGDSQVEITDVLAVAVKGDLGADSLTPNFIKFCESIINGTAVALHLPCPRIDQATCRECGDLSTTVSATISGADQPPILITSGVYAWDSKLFPYVAVVQSDSVLLSHNMQSLLGSIEEVIIITTIPQDSYPEGLGLK